MKRLLLIFLFFILFLTACKHDRGIILFNSQPITRENVLSDAKIFSIGQKVYYLFIAPNKMENDYIRVQVFKMTDKAARGGAEVLRTKDYRLMKDERYYHSNYFAFYEKGHYVMQVFSTEDFQHPLSIGDFYIK